MFWLGLVLGVPALASDVDAAQPTEKVPPIQRVAPRYPHEASSLGLSDVKCTAEIRLRPTGVPQYIRVADCFDPFADEAANALSQWRWPEGTPPQTQSIRFKFNGASGDRRDKSAVVVVRDPSESTDGSQFILPGVEVLVQHGDGSVISPVFPREFLGELAQRIAAKSSPRARVMVSEVLGERGPQQQLRVNCDLLIDVNDKGKVTAVSSDTCPPGTLKTLTAGFRQGRLNRWKGTPPGAYRLPLTLSAIRGPSSDLAYFRLVVSADAGANSPQ